MVVHASDSSVARLAFDLVRARVEAIEQASSDYRPDSEINRLSGFPAGEWHPVSADLYDLLRISCRLARHSRGAFDPTIGPLSKLWRRAIRQQTFPDRQTINRARAQVHYRWLTFRRDTTVRLDRDDLQLDLGGIAKGYALEEAAKLLQREGFPHFLLDGGGDLRLGQPPPNEPGWKIMTPAGSSTAHDQAVAVSGAHYRYLEHEGRRYSHIIDPRTGLGVGHFATVMVTGPDATLADGLASAISVLGQRDGRKLLHHYPGYTLWWGESVPSSP
jgi:thiamine biosynthesis lipoprotein